MKRFLGWLLGRGRVAAVVAPPRGYRNYSAADFCEMFNLADGKGEIARRDYLALFENPPKGFAKEMMEHHSDLGWMSQKFAERFEVARKDAASIARFYNWVVGALAQQKRLSGLGITTAKWRHIVCDKKTGGYASHAALDGQLFNLDEGIEVDGEWILPGVLDGCTCSASPNIPGFID